MNRLSFDYGMMPCILTGIHRIHPRYVEIGRVSAIFGSLFATSSKICTASVASSAPKRAKASLQREIATWLYSLSWFQTLPKMMDIGEAFRSLKENIMGSSCLRKKRTLFLWIHLHFLEQFSLQACLEEGSKYGEVCSRFDKGPGHQHV